MGNGVEKDLSIVIVTFGAPEMVRDCLHSIYQYNDIGEGLEVIISDNSNDTAVQDMINTEFQNVLFIKNDNIGFGPGNNRGVQISSGKYVLFLNPDTIIVESIFRKSIDFFEENPQIGMYGVQLLDRKGDDCISYEYNPEHEKKNLVISHLLVKLFNRINYFDEEKMFPYGAALMVRTKAFRDAGQFDENIFMYFEEADLSKRIRGLGYQVAYNKDIKIIHLVGKTSVNKLTQERIRMDSLRYYISKYKISKKIILHYIKETTNLMAIKNKLGKFDNIDEYKAMYEEIKELCNENR